MNRFDCDLKERRRFERHPKTVEKSRQTRSRKKCEVKKGGKGEFDLLAWLQGRIYSGKGLVMNCDVCNEHLAPSILATNICKL